jgi:hypothetical protein
MGEKEMTDEQKQAKAEKVMEKYFDVDIQDYESAMDVFLDNDVDPVLAREIADGMFPSPVLESVRSKLEAQAREIIQKTAELRKLCIGLRDSESNSGRPHKFGDKHLKAIDRVDLAATEMDVVFFQ